MNTEKTAGRRARLLRASLETVARLEGALAQGWDVAAELESERARVRALGGAPRVFVPRSQFICGGNLTTNVKRWTWTRSRGVRAEYTDGLTCKSEYTLPELLKIEQPNEVQS